jgi:hypothetical protein
MQPWWRDAFGWALVLAWALLVALIFWLLLLPTGPVQAPLSVFPG